MTDAEIFERFVVDNGLGSRFDRGRVTQAQWDMSYAHITNWAEHLIGKRKIVRSESSTYLGILISFMDPKGQAAVRVFKDQGKYFIGITTGLRFMLEFLSFRMLSDARVFQFVGNAAAEQSSFSPIIDYTTDAEQMYRKGVHTGRPKDDVRFRYAIEMITLAMFFVIGHELAHITRGHVDYLNSRIGTPIISECEEPKAEVLGAAWNLPTDDEKLDRQAIEMDADRRSVLSAISSAKNKHDAPESAIVLNGRNSVKDLLYDWSIAMNTFFRLFGDLRVTQSNVALGHYPPMPLRRFMAMIAAHFGVVHLWKAPISSDEAINALKVCIISRETTFQIFDGSTFGKWRN